MLPRDNRTTVCVEAASDRTVPAFDNADRSSRELDKDGVVFCKHVGGTAPDHVCVIFRTQVGETGIRMCEGCVIDAVLYRSQESIRDCVRVCNA
jgi:hypothetical protein